ncbi:MAG: SH3 domain-containing protein [Anaerolineae bacterium]|nr:SH3 domain-containing protein [Anaerolineae bacterium]
MSQSRLPRKPLNANANVNSSDHLRSRESRHLNLSALRLVIPLLLFGILALACNLGAEAPQATNTPDQSAATLIANSDVPEVEIRSPADNTQVIVSTEVQVYVRAVDKIGVTRVEMRANNQIVDTVASVDPAGSPAMDSLLSFTPTTTGPVVIQVVAFRGNVRGNPKTITLQVVTSAAQVTRPASSPVFLTASPTIDPVCRVRVDVDGLNVRTGPGVNYGIIGSLSLGQTVPVTGTNLDRSWYQISTTGLFGWVSSFYVTPQGVCSNILIVSIPPSPTLQPGATSIAVLPTFTPLPPFIQPTPTTTIPVVVLPTLTNTVEVPPAARTASIGDLTSTMIYATQTALAQPSPIPPTATVPAGVTATTGPTATATSTPTRPDLVAINVYPEPPSIPYVSPQTPYAYRVQVRNVGSATAPTFDVAVRTDTQTFSAPTTVVLNPGEVTEVTINVVFTNPGIQNIAIIADVNNVVANEIDKSNNVIYTTLNVIPPSATPGATSTPTLTFTPVPTETPIPTVTTAPSETPLPTETATTTLPASETPTETPTLEIVVPTETPTETPTSTSTLCPLATPELLLVEPIPTETTESSVTIVASAIGSTPIESITVSNANGMPDVSSTGNAPVVVPLAPGLNTLTVTVKYATVDVSGCQYGGYFQSTTTDRNGAPLTVNVVLPATATETPTETPTETVEAVVTATDLPTEIAVLPTETPTETPTVEAPTATVCPPVVDTFLLVEPLISPTFDGQVTLIVNTSSGLPIESVTVNSEAGSFNFAAGQSMIVPLVPGIANNFTVTARIAQTESNGCVYPPFDVATTTDRNGAPLQVIQQLPPTATELPTNTPEPTVCPPVAETFLIVEPLVSPTFDGQVTLIVNTSSGLPIESLTVSSEAGSFNFVAGQPIIVPLVPGIPNNFTVTARIAQTESNGCVYPPFDVATTTDRNGAPLQVIQQLPPTATEIPTNTPEPTVCPPAPDTALLVEPLTSPTQDQQVTLTVSTSSGLPIDSINVSSEAGSFDFGANQPITVPLVPGIPNNFTVTANIAQTESNGCVYPPTQVATKTDRNGAPLQVIQEVPPPPTDIPTNTPEAPQPNVVDLGNVDLITDLNNPNVQARVTDIFNRGKQNGIVAADFSLIGDGTLNFAGDLNQPGTDLADYTNELTPALQYFANGFFNVGTRVQTCVNNNLQPFDCANSANAAVAFVDVGRRYLNGGAPLDQFQNELTSLVNQLADRGIIPVLVTIAGPINDPTVAQYNTVIYNVANDQDLPLFNIYRIGHDNPALINGGTLTTPDPNSTGFGSQNFSGSGLQYGANNANLWLLRLLNQIKGNVMDRNP